MRAPLKRLHRFACAALVAASFQGIQPAHADWANFGTVSMTDATHPKLTNGYGCYTDGRDIICDSAASAVSFGSGGLISYGGATVVGTVSASAISSTYVSTTVLQINPSSMPCASGLNGTIRYSSTSNTLEVCTGTAWSTLSSNTTPGNISGTGSATAVAFWTGANSLSYDSGLYYDTSHDRLRVGVGPYISTTLDASGTVRAIAQMSNANVTGIGQANVANFVAWAPGTAQGQTVGMAFYPTFAGSVDNEPRRAADIIAGFNNGTWGNQYLAFNVGGAGTTANDAASTTIERMRITNGGFVGVGTQVPAVTLQVSGTFTVSNSLQTSATPSFNIGSNGTVGIGQNAGWPQLGVLGDVVVRGPSTNGNIYLQNYGMTQQWDLAVGSNKLFSVYDSTNARGPFSIEAGALDNLLYLRNTNAIGVGTNIPGSSLTVVGEVQTGSSGAPCVTATNGGAIRYSAGTLYYCNGSNTWSSITGGGAGFTGGGSATAIAFWNGPSSLTYESATTSGLYWDATNKRLGVGTNAPTEGLTVSNSLTGGTSADNAGISVNSANRNAYLTLNAANNWANNIQFYNSGIQKGAIVYYNNVSGNHDVMAFQTSGTEAMRIDGNGRVGVGISPTANLQVSGTFTVSQTGQNTASTASLLVDSRGVSVSSIVHINGSPISPIGAGGNAILSGTTAVSTSSAGSITFYTGGAQRVGIDVAGNVSIGKTNASYPLDVNGDARISETLLFGGLSNFYISQNIGTGYPGINFDAGDFIDYRRDVNALRFSANGGIKAFIDSGGSFWVGSSGAAPATQISPGGLGINSNAGSSGYWYTGYYRSGTAIGSVSQNGTTGILFNTSSDRRVKENITDTREGLQKLMQIGVKDFSFRADPSHTIVNGFIAQDLNKVYPEAVTTNGDNGEVPLKDKSKIWQVDYGRVTPLIVKAVQDLKHLLDGNESKTDARLDALAKQVEALQAQVKQLQQTKHL